MWSVQQCDMVKVSGAVAVYAEGKGGGAGGV